MQLAADIPSPLIISECAGGPRYKFVLGMDFSDARPGTDPRVHEVAEFLLNPDAAPGRAHSWRRHLYNWLG
jgi:hypothetical protein